MLPVWFPRPSRYPLRKTRRQRRQPVGHFRPRVETLEDRNLLNGGILDPTFGTGGLIRSTLLYHAADFAGSGYHTVAMEPNGQFVVAGVSSGSVSGFTVARFNANGSLDATFNPQGGTLGLSGAPGIAATAFGSGSTDVATAVAIEPDGKVVVVGYTIASGATQPHFAVARFNANGTLDTNFGNSRTGHVTIDFSSPGLPTNDVASCVAIDSAGRIVIGGTRSGTVTFGGASTPFGEFCVARMNSDGTVDSDFDADGKNEVNIGLVVSAGKVVSVDNLADIAVQTNGDVVAVGWTNIQNDGNAIDAANNFGIVRFNADGTLDKSFHTGAIAAALSLSPYNHTGRDPFEDRAYSVAIQLDGKILVSGMTYYQTVGDLTPAQSNFATIRLNTDGTFDQTFTPDGLVVTDFAADFTNGSEDFANDVTYQSDGKILVTGFTTTRTNGTIGPDTNIAMARYNTDGTLDQNFGVHGKVVIDVGAVLGSASIDDFGNQALPLGNGQILVVGATGDNNAGNAYPYASSNIGSYYVNNANLVVGRLTGFQAGTVQFSSANYSVRENGGLATITVTRVGGTSGTATVDFSTTNGTAVAGTDYTPVTGTLTFAPGVTSQTFTVVVKDDNVFQSFNKTINLALSNLNGGPTFGTPVIATLTLIEADAPGSGGTGGSGGNPPPSISGFVSQVYLDVLRRPVDSGGLAAWTNFLNGGGSRTQMVFDVEQSQEYRTLVINTLYNQYLHRAADSGGLNAFLSFMANGGTDEQVAELLAGSSEFYQKAGSTHDGFLNALYLDALNRGVDPQGRSTFDQFLANGGTTQQVATIILTSGEYRTDLIQSWYVRFLHRPADSAGLNAWLSLFRNGIQGPTNIFNPGGSSVTQVTDELIIAMLVGSQEYYNNL